MNLKDYKAFLESRAYVALDIYAAEEYFSNVSNVPDCIPNNVRDWTKVANQLDRMAELLTKARSGDASVQKCTTDAGIRKYVLGKDPYKKSMFEINADVMVHLDNPTDWQNSRELSEFAEELEHLGFPPRLKQHMKLVRTLAAKISGGEGVFSYDNRGACCKEIYNDVKIASESGQDVSTIHIKTRTNTGGPIAYKGGIAGMDRPFDEWTYFAGGNGYHNIIGKNGWVKTIDIDINRLAQLGVTQIIFDGGINIHGNHVEEFHGASMTFKCKYVIIMGWVIKTNHLKFIPFGK